MFFPLINVIFEKKCVAILKIFFFRSITVKRSQPDYLEKNHIKFVDKKQSEFYIFLAERWCHIPSTFCCETGNLIYFFLNPRHMQNIND